MLNYVIRIVIWLLHLGYSNTKTIPKWKRKKHYFSPQSEKEFKARLNSVIFTLVTPLTIVYRNEYLYLTVLLKYQCHLTYYIDKLFNFLNSITKNNSLTTIDKSFPNRDLAIKSIFLAFFVFVTRRRRDIKIPLCQSAPARRSLIK